MERAGAGVVEAMERHHGSLLALRVLVLCGTGNNGGDGFVAARHLAQRGARVRVGLLGERARVAGAARAHLERMEAAGTRADAIATEADLARLAGSHDAWDFALDALLGTGARGAPEGLIAAGVNALRELDDAGTAVIAVDMPTGANADTGAIARRAVRADLTVTFGFPKRGHFLYPASAFVGALEVVGIGLSPDAAGGLRVSLSVADDMARLLPTRDPRAHKGSVGRVLVVGGSPGLTGAVSLAAHAASRSGAGYVQVAVPASLHDIIEVKLTEEMTLPSPETADRTLSVAALESILARAGVADVVALGSGLSRHSETGDLARRIVAECDRPLVLDADALNAFEGRADDIARGRATRILTPHVGEMHRLTGLDPADVEARRIDVAREWAECWQSVVVLKGAPTVTASPQGHATVNSSGNAGLATAGTGDVLTGVIAALAAQGLAPYDAARLGVFLHGMAGDLAAAEKGQAGMIAGDVLESLPRATRELARGDATTDAAGASPAGRPWEPHRGPARPSGRP
jgi:NAD(P)H-hydrate epimerase